MNWLARRRRQRRYRRSLLALGLVGGSLALLASAGLLLRADQVVSERATLERPPETIWRVLTDFDGMPLWRSDLRSLERLPDLAGRPSWRETGSGGTRVMQLSAAQPPRLLVFAGTRRGEPAFPTRTVTLAALAHGTLVTLTEYDHVANPLLRVLNRARPPHGALRRFLRDLALRVNGRSIAISY